VVGTALAGARGLFAPLPAVAALAGALLIQIATNLANDYFDFVKGGDTDERLGPVRVVQAGLLAPGTVLRGAFVVLALATLVGAYLVWVGGVPILVIGLLSLLFAVAYTGGPFPLAYRGLGDLFAFVFFGPVAVAGTIWVQGRAFEPGFLVAGAGVGALVTAILVVNNLRDRETDARAGKRTLAVRLGVRGTRAEYVGLVAAALLAPLAGVAFFGWTPWTLLAAGALMPLRHPLVLVLGFDDPRELNPALGGTARGLTWYAGLVAMGFVLGHLGVG
jgi:1,4-dihydroxy-2-naphthoate polyprenyltransferase